jgi:hypothetical protein
MNIKFSYLYRDGSNYKNFNDVVFSNSNSISLHRIEEAIRNNLLDGIWFITKDWNVPDMHSKEFLWDSEIDHD